MLIRAQKSSLTIKVNANKSSKAKIFSDLLPEDTDLTMFTIQNLKLSKKKQLVIMTIVLKRKVVRELLITLVTIFFDKDLFSEVIAVNQGWPYCTESLMGGGVPKIITVWHGRVGV